MHDNIVRHTTLQVITESVRNVILYKFIFLCVYVNETKKVKERSV